MTTRDLPDDDVPVASATGAVLPGGSPAAVDGRPGRPTRAERLEAKAARLREAEAARAAGAGAPAASARPWQLATGVLAVLLIATLAVGIPYVITHHGRSSSGRSPSKVSSSPAGAAALGAAQKEVTAVARRAAVAFGSYDYRHLDTDFQAVLGFLTPAFRTSYTPVTVRLRPAIEKYHGTAKASIQCLGVSSLTPTHAVVVVCLDQSVTTTQSTTPSIDRNRAVVTLDKQADGQWLVSNLQLK